MSDERVERVAAAMYLDDIFRYENRHGTNHSTVIGHSWATIATEYPDEAEEWRHRAHAAIAALDAEPLEDVLRDWIVTEAFCDGASDTACYARVEERYKERNGDGFGATIAEAIRAAVAAAQEEA